MILRGEFLKWIQPCVMTKKATIRNTDDGLRSLYCVRLLLISHRDEDRFLRMHQEIRSKRI